MEYLDCYDENENYVGKLLRDMVHEKGIWHKTVHCWLYDSKGNIFFQRRADRQTLYTTASGHVLAGETVKEAFGREIYEELGTKIDYNKAEYVSVVNYSLDQELPNGKMFIDRAFAKIYLYKYDKDYDFNYDLNEITEIVKVNANDAKKLFTEESGSIKGEVIKLIDNELVIESREIEFDEFLVNDTETAITKYGEVLDKVIEITN